MLVSDAIRRCRDYLGGDQDYYSLVSGSLADTATTVDLQYAANGANRGALIEFRDSQYAELAYVWATDVDNDQLTVTRGWGGTTARTWADGTQVAVRPAVTDTEILDAMNDEIVALPGEGLYKKASSALTWDASENGYDLSAITDMISPYAVELLYGYRTHWAYELKRDNDLLRFRTDDGDSAQSATLHYRATFGSVTDKSTNLVSGVGIPDSAADIIPLGTAIRVLVNREAQRTQISSQTHARKSEDVLPGANVRTLSVLLNQRANRLRVERQRQREDWPMRIR